MTQKATITDIIVDFLEYMEIEQNRSQKTIENYDHYLQRLVEFAGDVFIEDIDGNEIVFLVRIIPIYKIILT